jgi:hypothetical protein
VKAIQTNLIIGSIRSRRDKSLSFTAETPELTSDEKVAFMDMQGLNLKALFEPLDETVEEVIEVEKDIDQKSQATRIRSVLFLNWKQEGEPGEFRDFYREKTEKYIEYLKGKLE